VTSVVQWLRLAVSKGPNRVGVFPHLRTETDAVSETLCFSLLFRKNPDDGQSPKTQYLWMFAVSSTWRRGQPAYSVFCSLHLPINSQDGGTMSANFCQTTQRSTPNDSVLKITTFTSAVLKPGHFPKHYFGTVSQKNTQKFISRFLRTYNFSLHPTHQLTWYLNTV
jgi:hypothetical protein